MPIDRRDAKPVKGVPGIKVVKSDDPHGLDRYIVRVVFRDPKTGKKKDREGVVQGTLENALVLRDRLRRKAAQDKTSRMRWRDYATRWAIEHLPTVEPSTRARYKTGIAHLNRGFGDHFVDALEPRGLRTWFREQLSEYAPATINGWIVTMRLVLDDAIPEGLLKANPARAVKVLPAGTATGRRAVALSANQFRRFVSALEELMRLERIAHGAGAMILTLAWTGARIGEARALRWEDWRDGELHIQRALWRHYVKATKDKDPRSVAVVEPLAEVLKEHRRRLLAMEHPGLVSGLMFPSSLQSARAGASRRGEDSLSWFKSGSCLRAPLLQVCKRAELPEMSPHALRRTWEKLMRKAEVDGMVRRSIAGWRTDTAQMIYSDVDSEDRAAAGRAMLRLVGGTDLLDGEHGRMDGEQA